MTKIKICGIRTLEDVDILNTYKPDYAGFILATSKRKVELPQLKELINALDKEIIAVGVFVNENIENVLEAVDVGIGIVQLHGDETLEYIHKLKDKLKNNLRDKNILIWKAVRVGKNPVEDLLKIKEYEEVDGILLDKYSSKDYGGTGETFNWHDFSNLDLSIPIILAGGLNISNVDDGIKALKLYAVDVSSGVEIDGKKDIEKIKEFIAKVRLNGGKD